MSDGLNLWLDDERQPPYGWCWAKSVAQAKTFVENTRFLGLEWNECSLDHDLGQFGEPGREGHDFLRWMCETGYWPNKKPVVHTSNAYEVSMMRQTIDRFFPGEDVEEVPVEMVARDLIGPGLSAAGSGHPGTTDRIA